VRAKLTELFTKRLCDKTQTMNWSMNENLLRKGKDTEFDKLLQDLQIFSNPCSMVVYVCQRLKESFTAWAQPTIRRRTLAQSCTNGIIRRRRVRCYVGCWNRVGFNDKVVVVLSITEDSC